MMSVLASWLLIDDRGTARTGRNDHDRRRYDETAPELSPVTSLASPAPPDNARAVTRPCQMRIRHSPVSRSHTRRVRSPLPLTALVPSVLIATAHTESA